jgi:hypothetical protein
MAGIGPPGPVRQRFLADFRRRLGVRAKSPKKFSGFLVVLTLSDSYIIFNTNGPAFGLFGLVAAGVGR